MKTRLPAAACAALSALLALPAAAGDKVYSPIVEQGEWEFESRLLFSHDNDPAINGQQNHVFEIGYGVKDWWATSALVEMERGAGEHGKATHAAWENIFQLTPQGKYWLDAGFYIELEKGLNGDADEIESKLLLEKQIYNWTTTVNLILRKHFGGDDPQGVQFGYNWRIKYSLTPVFEVGVEGYSDLGELRGFDPAAEQYHSIGPAILGVLPIGPGQIRYDLSYQAGLTHGTPDSSFQFNLEYEFRF